MSGYVRSGTSEAFQVLNYDIIVFLYHSGYDIIETLANVRNTI